MHICSKILKIMDAYFSDGENRWSCSWFFSLYYFNKLLLLARKKKPVRSRKLQLVKMELEWKLFSILCFLHVCDFIRLVLILFSFDLLNPGWSSLLLSFSQLDEKIEKFWKVFLPDRQEVFVVTLYRRVPLDPAWKILCWSL